jgi:ribosome-associated toxin RatA of RatAB toxin-antitoxin module
VDTSIEKVVRADRGIVFELASIVERWPQILPHYQRVEVLNGSLADGRIVEMAARRDIALGLAFPLWWRARQTLDRSRWRIYFEHVEGATRGMQVEWCLDASDATAVHVEIRHRFSPRWPVPDAVIHAVVGEYFVNGVARRTLEKIGQLAERDTHATI